ncbi:GNAT family N-acetyltransferase [Rhizobium sp. AAP43]|uniref:GNAT family N-acetyltransferase n=1 Tax=Rhizobium sp. AAP43 TaxID=1523420 RepID=UPI0006B88F20|nr:GNAT family N-acetyltransferase [Rhizobium sp. AAP43]KPF46880.1 hypothetical protein IP76_03150 [Rhizobium sp. AAP43]
MGPVSIHIEPADQSDVDRLLQLSDAVAARLYPGEYRKPITGKVLDSAGIEVFVARLKDKAIGCVASFDLGDGVVELKRLIVDPDHQGQGIGRALVCAMLEACRRRDIRAVVLEVGIRNIEARQLYEKLGFRNRDAFGNYQPTPVATFMQYDLVLPIR